MMKKIILVIGLIILTGVGALYLRNRNRFVVSSPSMAPTLLTNEVIAVDKSAFKSRAPLRGEVILFLQGDDPDFIIAGSVVYVGGDKISFQYRRLIVNDQPVEKEQRSEVADVGHGQVVDVHVVREELDSRSYEVWYLPEAPDTFKDPILVPKDHVLILGDNRDNSSDGRRWGALLVNRIIGKVTEVVGSDWPERVNKKID